MNNRLIAQLRREEGEVLHAYQDHLGYLTIGVGRLIDKRKGGGISEEESAYLLSNDVRRIDTELRAKLPWADALNEARRGALIGMAFQMGVAGLLYFKRALAAMRDEHWATAAVEMLDSTWAKQTPDRARRMARQIETGEWQS